MLVAKGCRKCGGTQELREEKGEGIHGGWYELVCLNCGRNKRVTLTSNPPSGQSSQSQPRSTPVRPESYSSAAPTDPLPEGRR